MVQDTQENVTEQEPDMAPGEYIKETSSLSLL